MSGHTSEFGSCLVRYDNDRNIKGRSIKVLSGNSCYHTDNSLLKMLYLAMVDITKKWTGRRQDWSMIHAQLAVFFADRMPD